MRLWLFLLVAIVSAEKIWINDDEWIDSHEFCEKGWEGPGCSDKSDETLPIFDDFWPLKYEYTEYHVAHGPRADLFPCDGDDRPVCISTGYVDRVDFKSEYPTIKGPEPMDVGSTKCAENKCGPTCDDDCLEAGDKTIPAQMYL